MENIFVASFELMVANFCISVWATWVVTGCPSEIDEVWGLHWPSTAQGDKATTDCGAEYVGRFSLNLFQIHILNSMIVTICRRCCPPV